MAKDFKIAKTGGKCHVTGQEIAPGDEFIALVRTTEEELLREDYSLAGWEQVPHPETEQADNVLGTWRTRMPAKEEKKKLLVDDPLLINFFQRLASQEDDSRVAFRYVLCLILMRKKLLVYEGSHTDEQGRDLWKMRLRGSDETHEVIDPHLDEDRIHEVSQSLGDIMEGDFE